MDKNNKNIKDEDESTNENEYRHAFLFWANINFYRDYSNNELGEHFGSPNSQNSMSLDGEEETEEIEEINDSAEFRFKIEDLNDAEFGDGDNFQKDKNSLISNILNNSHSNISLSNLEKDIMQESSFFYNAHLLFEAKVGKYEDELTFLSPLYISQKKGQGSLGSVTMGQIVETNNPKEAESKFWEKATNLSEDLNTSEFDIYVEITHVTYSLLPFSIALRRLDYMNALVLNNMKKLSELVNNKPNNVKFDDDSENEEDDLDESIRDIMEDINQKIKEKHSKNNKIKMPKTDEETEEIDNNENNEDNNDSNNDSNNEEEDSNNEEEDDDGGMSLI